MFDGTNQPPPAPIQQDPLETALAQRLLVGQLAQQDIHEAIARMAEAWRRDRARIAELEAQLTAARNAMAIVEPR